MLITIIGGLALVLFLVWLVNEEKTRSLEKEMKKSVEQHIKDTENILLSFSFIYKYNRIISISTITFCTRFI